MDNANRMSSLAQTFCPRQALTSSTARKSLNGLTTSCQCATHVTLTTKNTLPWQRSLRFNVKQNSCLAWIGTTQPASEILNAKYGEVSTDDVVDQLTHLNEKQKQDLKVLLKNFTKLFNGTLGVYPHKKFHIDLVPGARPKHSQPYAILFIHLAAFKKELDRLV
jgi:hypothetical protein